MAQPRAPRRQEREHHDGGGAGAVHEPRAPTMAKECRQRKPCPAAQDAASRRPRTTSRDDGQSAASRSERSPKTCGSSCHPSPTPSTVRSCAARSEEHTSEPQSLTNLVCRLLREK